MTKFMAYLLAFFGGAGFVTGLLGVFGPPVIAFSPWTLTIVGFLFFLSGYGLLRRDLDEV